MTVLVLCHGVFDVLHVGHVRHLRAAKSMGDRLVVSITADDYCTKRVPVFNQELRREMLFALRYVDEVWISSCKTAVGSLRYWKPDIFCKGIDYKETSIIREEELACLELGVKLRFTETEKFASSRLIVS